MALRVTLCLCLPLACAGCWSPRSGSIEIVNGEAYQAWRALVATSSESHPSPMTLSRVDVTAAVGETVGFELVVSAGGDLGTHEQRLEIVSAVVEPLEFGDYVIAADAVTIFRAVPVESPRLPGWHIRFVDRRFRRERVPDVLIPSQAPKGGSPWPLAPGVPLHLWVDVTVPVDAAPGHYRGELRLGGSSAKDRVLPVHLKVLPLTLPRSERVTLIAPLDHRRLFEHHIQHNGRPFRLESHWGDVAEGAQADALLRDTMTLLREHGLTPVLDRLHPVLKVGSDGIVEVNWDDYDRVVAPYLIGDAFSDGEPLRRWKIPFDETFPPARAHDPMTSSSYAGAVRDYLAEAAAHFAWRGWFDRSYVELPQSGESIIEDFQFAMRFGLLAAQANDELVRICRLFPQDMSWYGWWGFEAPSIEPYVDGWMPPASMFEVDVMAEQRRQGKYTWMIPDRPPYSGSVDLSAPAGLIVGVPWTAYRYDIPVVHLRTVNEWPEPKEALTFDDIVGASPDSLLYPGSLAGMERPLASVRLKRLRQAMNDLRYAAFLESHSKEHVPRVVAESLVPYALSEAYGRSFADGRPIGIAEEEMQWNLAREIMIRESEASLPVAASTSLRDLDHQLNWRSFLNTTRALDLIPEGMRISPGPSPSSGPEVECGIVLVNRTRLPISGRLTFAGLPTGWETIEGGSSFDDVPPLGTKHLVLRAKAESNEALTRAPRDWLIAVDLQEGAHPPVSVRFSCVSAEVPDAPPRIDGDLSEWTVQEANRLDGFLSVNRDPAVSGIAAVKAAGESTQAFVSMDREFLYLGVEVESDTSGSTVSTNQIQYDDLVPRGADLVEVLIDPENVGTHAPDRLFHLVISTGGVVAEKGIGCNPPIGPRYPWDPGIRYAIDRDSHGWTAEIRLPVAAFGEHALAHSIWGFNVTRFDITHQEYSTWSGSFHNAYDPMSLGNLIIPERLREE